MTTTSAAALRDLHVPGRPLVLPNAWNAASARAVEAAGFPAVATSSAAVSEVLGHEDGHATPVEGVLASVTHIVRSVDVPVTVDFERGYGLGPDELVARLAETGAVGANLEDSDPATGAHGVPSTIKRSFFPRYALRLYVCTSTSCSMLGSTACSGVDLPRHA